jgi:hypothetical protein
MIRIDSSWSGLPQAPNIIAPRQSGLTWTPVAPSGRYSTRRAYRRAPSRALRVDVVAEPGSASVLYRTGGFLDATDLAFEFLADYASAASMS